MSLKKASNLSFDSVGNGANTLLSRDGYTFCLYEPRWTISKSVTIDLSWLKNALEERLQENYRKVISHFVQNNSPGYVRSLNYYSKIFLMFSAKTKGGAISEILKQHIIGFHSSLGLNRKYNMAKMLPVLKKWHELGYEGVSDSAINAISELRIKNADRGKAVRMLCPYEGPLSDMEYEGLYSGLSREFEKGNVDLKDMVVVKLLLATGRRPAQISHLKIKDFLGVQVIDGNRFDLIRIPKVKQRTVWRKEFSEYALAPDLGELLRNYLSSLELKIRSIFGDAAPNTGIFPLFPQWQKIKKHIKENGLSNFDELLDKDLFHPTATQMGDVLSKVVQRIELISERTGKKINIFPLRLRRTLASRAAREGYGVLVIARLLDHADTQSAHIYTENTPEHLTTIDKAMAMQVTPLVQAFAGTLVPDESHAKRGDELSSRIRSRQTGKGIGTCGTYSFCSALAPIACYTCHHFQPWLDAPHEEILDDLIKNRQEIIERTRDKTLASVNDRVIFAVSQVVQLCKERKHALSVNFSGVKHE